MSTRVDRLYATLRQASEKTFPAHWTFLFGEVALFCFGVLVLSGLYLALFYEASAGTVLYSGSYAALEGVPVSRAFHSVMDITFERRLGWVIRQTHHWAALVFIAALVLHAARIFFTGAFRRPRRLNWMIGVTLLGLAMATGYFGFVLPHDLLAGTSGRIGHALALSVPLIGPGLAEFVFAGEFGNPDMLHRLWWLHVIILPIVMAALLAGHLGLVWVQTHTQFRRATPSEDVVRGSRAWPAYTIKTVGLAAVVAGTLLALGAIFEIEPLWIYGPFDPASTTVPAQSDWYLGWVEGGLRVLPSLGFTVAGGTVPSPFIVGVALPLLLGALLFAWPFLEAWITGDREPHHLLARPRDHPVRTGLGATGLTVLAILLLAGSHDVQAFLLGISVETMTIVYRWVFFFLPPLVGLLAFYLCRALAAEEVA